MTDKELKEIKSLQIKKLYKLKRNGIRKMDLYKIFPKSFVKKYYGL